jgi:hypothetical protein
VVIDRDKVQGKNFQTVTRQVQLGASSSDEDEHIVFHCRRQEVGIAIFYLPKSMGKDRKLF